MVIDCDMEYVIDCDIGNSIRRRVCRCMGVLCVKSTSTSLENHIKIYLWPNKESVEMLEFHAYALIFFVYRLYLQPH